MRVHTSDLEAIYEDYDEDSSFEKLTHKAKTVRSDKKASIQKKRKEKMRAREEEEKLSYVYNTEDEKEETY